MSFSASGRRCPLAVPAVLATWLLAAPVAAQTAQPTAPGAPAETAQPPAPTQPAQPPPPPSVSESIQVTATRVPEDVEPVPSSITVVSGEELTARGATDLASALSIVAGVAVAPGGDAGSASSVPELWGLREFDA